jgi:hypothetical protein
MAPLRSDPDTASYCAGWESRPPNAGETDAYLVAGRTVASVMIGFNPTVHDSGSVTWS